MKRVQTHHWMKRRVRMPTHRPDILHHWVTTSLKYFATTSSLTKPPHPWITLPPHPASLSIGATTSQNYFAPTSFFSEQATSLNYFATRSSLSEQPHHWITLPPDPPSLSNHITELLCHHILPHWAPTSLNYFANRSSLTEQPHHWITFPPHPPSHSHHTTSLSLRSLRCGSYKHPQNS